MKSIAWAMHTCVLLLLVVNIAGCGGKAVRTENPAAFAAVDYDPVFDAAVAELRDLRFVVDRQDRRFGIVSTAPLIASSFVEPWHQDNTTAAQILESTLNLDRRIARVELAPARSDKPAAEATQPPTRYELSVQVSIERRVNPPRQLTTSALGVPRTTNQTALERPVVTERGRQESYWRAVGHDPHLEQRLINAILTRAASRQELNDLGDALSLTPNS